MNRICETTAFDTDRLSGFSAAVAGGQLEDSARGHGPDHVHNLTEGTLHGLEGRPLVMS